MYEDNFFTVQLWEQDAAQTVGITVSMFRFMLSFFASVAMGAGLRYVPTVTGRHVYAITTGLLLIYYPFGNGVYHNFVPALITYAAMYLARKQCGRIAWVVDFTYLVGCHVASASGSAWKEGNMDFTGSQMVLTLKVISAAVNYQDGLRNEKDLTQYQQTHRLRAMPNLLEYLSYIFASGNLLAGPTFELSDYIDYIERKGPWDPDAARPMPSPVGPGLIRFAKALVCMGLHLWLVSIFHVDILEGQWYSRQRLPTKMVVIWLVGMVYRIKFYFAWTVSEAALILSGFCFNGWDKQGRARWDRYSNARILNVELSTSLAELPVHWNTCTGNFLRQYVYERLTPRGKRPPFYVLLVTQLVAAVWHGLFSGYGMFFGTSAFMFEASRVIYRYERAYGPQSGLFNPRTFPPWVIFKWAFTAFVLNYAAVSFLLIDFWPGWRAWRSVYFLGHILILAIMAAGTLFPPPHKSKGQARPAAEAEHIPGVGSNGQNGEKKIE